MKTVVLQVVMTPITSESKDKGACGMTLEGSNVAITVYVLFLFIALALSYLYAWKGIELTGLFGSQVAVATVMNLFLGACAIFGWFFYAWGTSEALFLSGLVLGAILLVVSEVALITTLFVRRDKLLEAYRERMDNGVSNRGSR
ncbi:hypothetical protein FH966_04130 [Lentibacillus cibarius]|uniref:Uncharacterized protein n=1 Tax=Lentibacillus cibarius TaxID=2583219 RepID=A0A549YGH4_9BACI|nr:hypothetical protein [Lentibacillus cibarius]TRM10975.1 hypothetical protein FH966_04130 [Lentibacillus cibarius]